MANLAPLMSSRRETWNTPEALLSPLREFAAPWGGIGLDPCSNETSIVGAKTEWRLGRDGDSLARSWQGHGLIYCNPPYGRAIGPWVAKCRAEGERADAPVVALLPARPDTRWFWDCFPPRADAICWWRRRLTFLGAPAAAPFPSVVVLWGPDRFCFADVFGAHGVVWK